MTTLIEGIYDVDAAAIQREKASKP